MEYIDGLRRYIGNQPILMVGSTVLILNAQNRLLMMKRSDSSSWGVPGGAMELGETTEETARRELFEEAGLEVGELTLFGVFSGKELYYRYPSGEEVCDILPTPKGGGFYRQHGCEGEPSSYFRSGSTLMSQRIEILRTFHVQFSLVGVECFTG